MRMRLRGIVVCMIACTSAILAQPAGTQWGQRKAAYDTEFTFVRLRWRSGTTGRGIAAGSNNFWLHEFPRAEQNLMAMLKDFTSIDAKADGSLILTLDDPDLFKYPIAMMWEPGFWVMTDVEARNLREYLLKGGFIIFNDFELDQWDNFQAQMTRVLPDARWLPLDGHFAIFDTFFRIRKIDFPHPPQHHLFGYRPLYFGLFEDNDSTQRLMAIANYNTNLAEYWQYAATGFFPIEPSNEAFKLGINYMVYGLTH
jgi:hypothetical protein